MSKPFIFRQDEKFTLNYTKPISFQITDWRSFDYKPPFNPDTDKGRYRKEFRAQLFGVTSKGRSVSAVIYGFKPFFFAEIPEEWTEGKVIQLIKTINKLVPEYETKSLISYNVIKKRNFEVLQTIPIILLSNLNFTVNLDLINTKEF